MYDEPIPDEHKVAALSTNKLAPLGIWILLWLALPLFNTVAGEEEQVIWTDGSRQLTQRELHNFMHIDCAGPEARTIIGKVVAAGTNLVPHWGRILKQSDDGVEIMNALSQLDRIPVFGAAYYSDMKAVFEKVHILGQNRTLLQMLIQTVGKYGVTSDTLLILPYLSDENAVIRVATAQSLAAIGNAESLRVLEEHLKSAKASAVGVEAVSANELKDLRQSIDRLKSRLGAMPLR